MSACVAIATSLFLFRIVGGDYISTDGCSASTQYRDLGSLNCETCSIDDNLKVVDTSELDIEDIPTGCKCETGYMQVYPECGARNTAIECDPFTCEVCPTADTAATQDQLSCMACDNTMDAHYDETLKDCRCPEDMVLVEKDAAGAYLPAKICMDCPDRTRVFQTAEGGREADLYTCQTCPDPMMSFSAAGVCVCDAGYDETGVEALGDRSCVLLDVVPAIYPAAEAAKVEYYDVESRPGGGLSTHPQLHSLWMQHLYLSNAAACYNYQGPAQLRACQALANLCVLQLNNPDATACELFEESIAAVRPLDTHGYNGWAPTLPWLKYEDDALSVLRSRDLQMRVAFTNSSSSSSSSRRYATLRFVMAKWSLNGTWLGFEPLGSQLQYCSAPPLGTARGPSMSSRWLHFGNNHQETYTCDLQGLLTREPLFYDLYFVDEAGGGSDAGATGSSHIPSLTPVPLRLVNYREQQSSGASRPNHNERQGDNQDDQLTRRFFLWDTYSGVTAESESEGEGGGEPEVVRYATSIQLEVRIRSDDSERLHPPLLTVEYRERRLADIRDRPDMATAGVSFGVEYSMELGKFWTALNACFSVTLVVAGMVWILRVYKWLRYAALEAGDGEAQYLPVRAAVMALHAAAEALFWLMFVFSAYWYIFFKMSKEVYTLLPQPHPEYGIHDDYYPFQVVLHLCFFGQLGHMLHLIYDQTHMDVFFVDWEQPRGRAVGSSSSSRAGSSSSNTVSVWRTLLVANEWAEMQTVRKTSLPFTLAVLLWLLVGLDLQNLATHQPDATALHDAPGGGEEQLNPVLRFFNTTFWILVLSYVQRMWNFFVAERYIGERKSSEFIDLATMAKISVVVLPERYHGYYLHCRSPHTHADGDMLNLAEQLRSEEERQSAGGRGLDGAPLPDMQTFELHVTARFRRRYDAMYAALSGRHAAQQRTEQGRLGQLRGSNNKQNRKPPPEKIVRASRRLNKFLQNWVDQNEPDFKRAFSDYLSFFSRVVHMPPEMGNAPASLLYPDPNHKFTEVTFLGIERELILMNALMFAMADYWLESSVTSALWVYLLEQLLIMLRQHFGRTNLAEKTMIDDRFLV